MKNTKTKFAIFTETLSDAENELLEQFFNLPVTFFNLLLIELIQFVRLLKFKQMVSGTK